MENSFFDKVLKVKPIVVKVLQESEDSRDDDNVLILSVWSKQADVEIKQFSDLKKMLLSGRLSPPATIIRSRRKLQVNDPSLRGKLYEERKKEELWMKNQIKMDFDGDGEYDFKDGIDHPNHNINK